jgi:oligo-1,6-glucosidase
MLTDTTDMRFWLDKGIGGFRMDVINMISKTAGLPDAPVTVPSSEYQPACQLYCNGPHIHEYLREIRSKVLDHYPDVMTVGEVPMTHEPEHVRQYVEPDRKELCMLFQFDIFNIDTGKGGKFTPSGWQLKDLKTTITKWQQSLSFSSGAWQTVFLESHDAARSVSRFGDRNPDNRFKVAKMLAMLETTLSGTLFLHQGQEIGMANLADDIPIEEYMDIETKGFLHDLRELRQATTPDRVVELKEIVDEVADEVRLKARDHGRMPMPWNGEKTHAGFSDASDGVRPWTRINSDFDLCNVAHQEKLSNSVLHYWRRMLAFRKANAETLLFGDFEPVSLDNGPVFAYHRVPLPDAPVDARKMLVVLNMTSDSDVDFVVPADVDGKSAEYKIIESSRSKKGHNPLGKSYQTGEEVRLRAYEGLILSY